MENNLDFRNLSVAGLMGGTVLLLVATLAACNREAPPQTTVVMQPAAPVPTPPPAVSAPAVVATDDYVYYPQYQIYYSNTRHQYTYEHGGAWVWESAPPQVSVGVLFASPSVHMDFHDAPARHHETVVRSYPHNWAPPPNDRRGPPPGRGPDGRGPGGN